MSETSDLDPGEEVVQFRQTITFNVLTQMPVKVDMVGLVYENIANVQMGEWDFDSTDYNSIRITVQC